MRKKNLQQIGTGKAASINVHSEILVDVPVDNPNTKALEASVEEILTKVSKFEKGEITSQLRDLLLARLKNEFYVSEGIRTGIENGEFPFDKAIELLKNSKDNISSLTSALKEFESGIASGGRETRVIIIREGSAPVMVDTISSRQKASPVRTSFSDEVKSGN